MKRIGLLSDTHSYWDERFAQHLAECDEIWHAGDIGSMLVIDRLREVAPIVRAVHGNIDGGDVRRLFPQMLRWNCEGADVLMTHIGGYPGKYEYRLRPIMYGDNPPKLFISGHSHILKVQYDKSIGCLHINPGAAGQQGWQTARTLVRFTAHEGQFADLEVIELGRRRIE